MKYEILGRGYSIDEWMDSNGPLKKFRSDVETHLKYASEEMKERFVCIAVRELIHKLVGEDELK